MTLRFLFLLLLPVMAAPAVVRACSCLPPPPPEEALAQADAVFAGEVVGVRKAGLHTYRVTLRVLRRYKGTEDAVVTLETPRDSASCGFGFEKGRSYLVYARAGGGLLTTNLCTRTARAEHAGEDVQALGEGEPVAATASRCGGPAAAAVQVVLFVLLGLRVGAGRPRRPART